MMGKFYILFFFFALNFPALFSAQSGYNSLIFEGNQAFKAKKYENSTSKFLEASKAKPNDFAAHYNLGNSFYQRKMYAEAEAEFTKASKFAKTKDDKMAALYNLGNTHMQNKNPEKAAEFYKQALKQDPYNEFARKNYQIAMLKDKEKQQQQSKGGKGGGGGKDGKNPQQQNDDKGKGQQQNGQGNQQDGKGGQGNQPDQNKSENNAGMPKDLQDAIMKRTQDKEKETARRILNKNSYSMPQSNEKDW